MLKITDYNTTHGIPLDLDEPSGVKAEELTRIEKSDVEVQPSGIELAEPDIEAMPDYTKPQESKTLDDALIIEDEHLIGLHEVLIVEREKLRGRLPKNEIPRNLSSTFKLLEEANLKALCLSGGGIRSATFGLGVIQALAKHGLLDKFDYLSTVSGGGYVGSWLSAWIYREQEQNNTEQAGGSEADPDNFYGSEIPDQLNSFGVKKVQEKINCEFGDDETDNPSVEPDELRHLRDYSNYMSPRTGLLSADTWTLIGTYFRNLVLNWTVALPLLAAFLLIPRIVYSLMFNASDGLVGYAYWVFLGGLMIGSVGLAYVVWRLPSKRLEQPQAGDSGKSVLVWSVIPLCLFSIATVTVFAWHIQSSTVAEAFRDSSFPIEGTVVQYLIYSAALFILGYMFFLAVVLVRWMFGSQIRTFPKLDLWGTLAALVASINGGLLIWLIQKNLPTYNAVEAFGSDFALLTPLIYQCIALPIFVLTYLFAATIFIGLSSRLMNDADREWMARLGAWLLIISVIWLLLNVIVLFGPYLIDWMIGAEYGNLPAQITATVTVVSGLAAGFIALFGGFSGSTPAKESQTSSFRRSLMNQLPRIASGVFLVFILASIAYLTGLILRDALPILLKYISVGTYETPSFLPVSIGVLRGAPILAILILLVLFAALGTVMSLFVNVNKFSLHGGYRDRLIRAYLGASSKERRPDPFTGFDDADNIQLHRLSEQKPIHIVNATINLVGGKKLAWQQRKAGPFAMTPFHCGSWITGYRPTNRYSRNLKLGRCEENKCNHVNTRLVDGKRGRRCSRELCELPGKSIRLGTAMAISGAAANPNMGYYSSGIVTFLMALFNFRLGWWLGNPGRVKRRFDENGKLVRIEKSKDFFGTEFWTKTSPSIAALPLLNETLGRTDGDKRYVNVSDGGHFENLGLYEVMLRRCKLVVLSDAGADSDFKFGDLSNAIRKCKVDLGVDIEFKNKIEIYGRGEGAEIKSKGKRFAIADVTFPEKGKDGPEKGILIYLRPAYYENEPIEISTYAKQNLTFPHQTTGDQFYDELQFEAYRCLGFLTMETALRELDLEIVAKLKGTESEMR